MSARLIPGLVVTVLLVVVTARPLGADAVFVSSSPAPRSEVGGSLSDVQIVFNERVTGAVLSVEGPEGAVGLDSVVDAGQVVSASFLPLKVEGRYLVRYEVISADTDPVSGGFSFTYRRGAPAALPVVAPALDDGSNRALWLIAGVGAVGLGLLATQTYRRARRLRRAQRG